MDFMVFGLICYSLQSDAYTHAKICYVIANLVQWHTPSRNLWSASGNLLSVTRCNISFGARGFRSAVPAIWNSLPLTSVLVKLSQHSTDTSNLMFSIQP